LVAVTSAPVSALGSTTHRSLLPRSLPLNPSVLLFQLLLLARCTVAAAEKWVVAAVERCTVPLLSGLCPDLATTLRLLHRLLSLLITLPDPSLRNTLLIILPDPSLLTTLLFILLTTLLDHPPRGLRFPLPRSPVERCMEVKCTDPVPAALPVLDPPTRLLPLYPLLQAVERCTEARCTDLAPVARPLPRQFRHTLPRTRRHQSLLPFLLRNLRPVKTGERWVLAQCDTLCLLATKHIGWILHASI